MFFCTTTAGRLVTLLPVGITSAIEPSKGFQELKDALRVLNSCLENQIRLPIRVPMEPLKVHAERRFHKIYFKKVFQLMNFPKLFLLIGLFYS